MAAGIARGVQILNHQAAPKMSSERAIAGRLNSYHVLPL